MEVSKLRARLASAQVIEFDPDFPLSTSTFDKLTTTKVMGKSLFDWILTLHDMEQMFMPPRADAPPPTDAELRERLRAKLPEGWEVRVGKEFDTECYVAIDCTLPGIIAYPKYATLRKPGGIEACARALRVLAGAE